MPKSGLKCPVSLFFLLILYSVKTENMKILILNGPNLNLLGIREKNIYGETSFEDYLSGLRDFYTMVEIEYYQSNVEGELINKIHEVGFSYDGIILTRI